MKYKNKKYTALTNNLPVESVAGRNHEVEVEHHRIGQRTRVLDETFKEFVCTQITYDNLDNIAYVYYENEDDQEFVVVMPNPYWVRHSSLLLAEQ